MQIRPALPADQAVILQIVYRAGINPLGLAWQRFVVAEQAGRVIGVAQIKPHRDGSHELASLAVIPAWQNRGVGSALIRTLQEQSTTPLFLICAAWLQPYYDQFGFVTLTLADMPPYFKRIARLMNLFTTPSTRRLAVMRWDIPVN